MPRISIVTVVKNDCAGLRTTIESALGQSSADFEVVIADGGSEDGSLELAYQYAETGVRVLAGPDSGIYDGMNRGLAASIGDFVWFVNAGDALADTEAVADVTAFLEVGSCRWMYGAVRPVDHAGLPAGPVLLPEFSRRGLEWKDVHLNHQGMLMERGLLNELGGFRTRFRLAAEYDLYLRAAEVASPVKFSRVLVDYLAGGASFSHREEHLKEMAEARLDVLHLKGLDRARNTAVTRYRILRTRSRIAQIPLVRSARSAYLKRRYGSDDVN